MDSPSMVEIAAKQRHVLLLKKVRNNQPLTAGELRELKDYESMAKKATKKTAKKTPRKSVKSVVSKPSPDWAQLCELAALSVEADGEAAAVLAGRLETPAAALEAMEGKTPGRLEFLARLAGLAASPLPEAQAADRLGLTAAAFAERLKSDGLAGAIWRHTRTDAQLKAYRDLQRQSAESPAAAKQLLEHFAAVLESGGADFRRVPLKRFAAMIGEKYDRVLYWKKKGMPVIEEGAGRDKKLLVDLDRVLEWWKGKLIEEHRFDPTRLLVSELEPYLGVSRVAIADWIRHKGMPQNRDREQTVNLFEALAWQRQQLSQREGAAPAAVNPLADAKAKMKELEYQKAVGQVVDRVAVELGLAARCAREIQVLEQKFRELPGTLAGHTAGEIQEVLGEVLRAFRSAAAQVPEDILDVIPERRRSTLEAFLTELAAESEEAGE